MRKKWFSMTDKSGVFMGEVKATDEKHAVKEANKLFRDKKFVLYPKLPFKPYRMIKIKEVV